MDFFFFIFRNNSSAFWNVNPSLSTEKILEHVFSSSAFSSIPKNFQVNLLPTLQMRAHTELLGLDLEVVKPRGHGADGPHGPAAGSAHWGTRIPSTRHSMGTPAAEHSRLRAAAKAAGLEDSSTYRSRLAKSLSGSVSASIRLCKLYFMVRLNRFKIATRTASLFLDYTALSTIAFWFTTRISRCYRNIHILYYFLILGCLPCLRKSLNCQSTCSETLFQGRILYIVPFLISGLLVLLGDK